MSLFTSSFEIGATRAARLLNTSPDTVLRLIEDGSLEAYQLRARSPWRISYDSVVQYRNKIREKFGLDDPKQANSSAQSAVAARIR